MKYQFRATRTFWRALSKLPAGRQAMAREAFRVFKENPFDPRLRSHKIHRLSAYYGHIIYAAEIGADLRAIFYVAGDKVVTVDIGSHDVYRG